jgi:hypothetical protein
LKAKLVANKKTRATFNVRGAVNILGSPYIRLLERKLTAEAARRLQSWERNQGCQRLNNAQFTSLRLLEAYRVDEEVEGRLVTT